ncbi:hypothetical protein L208DRAFT_1398803 [Tricholoma matsutake]|nr:hypothetical protein L208DRAFT_1398803 [Tricholoma matsutake 945]
MISDLQVLAHFIPMAQLFTFQSKSPYQWNFHLSILNADDDTREAPWYAAWDLVLRDQIFANFCQPPYFTVTYPQFPVSRHIDTYHLADDIIDDEGGSDDDEDDGGGSCRMTLSPFQHSQTTPPNRNRLLRPGAPSPEASRRPSTQLLDTPPAPWANNPSPPGKKSTRIPDFAQLLYEVRMNSDGTVPRPIEYRILSLSLIVEVKKCTNRPTAVSFTDILPQTDQQARRVFITFPSMRKLGVIIAIGAYWTYFEYDRDDVRPSPSRSEQKDTTFMEDPSPPSSPAQVLTSLHGVFGPDGFARLESRQSDEGLQLISRRVKNLSGIGREG